MKTTKLKIVTLILATAALSTFNACKKDPLSPTGPAGPPAYTSIVVNGGHLVNITQGTASSISFTPGVKYGISNGVLTIDSVPATGTIHIQVTSSLTGLTANGGAAVYSGAPLNLSQLTVTSNRGSLITLDLTSKNIKANATQGAELTLKGTTDELTVNGSDNSHFYGCSMVSKNCTVTANSGSMCSVNATLNLTTNVTLTSGSVITYGGNPVVKKNGNGVVLKGCL